MNFCIKIKMQQKMGFRTPCSRLAWFAEKCFQQFYIQCILLLSDINQMCFIKSYEDNKCPINFTVLFLVWTLLLVAHVFEMSLLHLLHLQQSECLLFTCSWYGIIGSTANERLHLLCSSFLFIILGLFVVLLNIICQTWISI